MSKKHFTRFAITASGWVRFYVACDLDEGLLWYWPGGKRCGAYSLAHSSNLDERSVSEFLRKSHFDKKECLGFRLTESDICYLKSLLTVDKVESLRHVDDRWIWEKSRGWTYRDGWSIDFYAESDCGPAPLHLKCLSSCSDRGDEEVFELVEDYVFSKIIKC